MKLWQTIISNIIYECIAKGTKEFDIEKLFDNECYILLERIKSILEDTESEDCDCFDKIERIVQEFEKSGSDCGARHDFG